MEDWMGVKGPVALGQGLGGCSALGARALSSVLTILQAGLCGLTGHTRLGRGAPTPPAYELCKPGMNPFIKKSLILNIALTLCQALL